MIKSVAVLAVYCVLNGAPVTQYGPADYFETEGKCKASWAFTKEYGQNINCSSYACVPETISVDCSAGSTSWMCK